MENLCKQQIKSKPTVQKNSMLSFSHIFFSFVIATFEINESAGKLPLRVAVIGSGITGAGTAYYLNEYLGDDVDITIFEKANYTGGRIQHFKFQGQTVEIGANLLLEENKLVTGLVDKFDLKKERFIEKKQVGYAATWDGQYMSCTGCETSILKYMYSRWKYAYKDVAVIQNYTKIFMDKLFTLYDNLENQTEGFEHPNDIFELGGFDQLIQKPFIEVLQSVLPNWRNSAHVKDIIGGVIRCNYGQGFEVNGFLGSVQLIGLAVNIKTGYNVMEGNNAVGRECIKRSTADIKLNTEIESISTTVHGTINLTSTEGDNFVFDKVVIASPLFLTQIKLDGRQPSPDFRMVYLHIYYIHARLNGDYFGHNQAYVDKIEIVLVTDPHRVKFNNIGRQAIDLENKGYALYKIFSKTKISDKMLANLFIDIKDIKVFKFHTFPYYDNPINDFRSFKMAPNIYYTNTFERIISAMEYDLLAARNVAKLITNSHKKANKTRLAFI